MAMSAASSPMLRVHEHDFRLCLTKAGILATGIGVTGKRTNDLRIPDEPGLSEALLSH